ncbi:hypothetical protein SUGI_0326730 [Cryptomeria japonica]|nr:hypothetical protein SUGI_0326730 [Cryptomeria japonica]
MVEKIGKCYGMLSNSMPSKSDVAAANGWVNDNIRPFSSSVNIKYIAVGNEVYSKYLLPAINNIQKANLQNKIKVSTPHAASVLSNPYPPSQGTFAPDMRGILKFLSDNGSPFMAQVYPYFSYKGDRNSISADYALFISRNTVMKDGGRMYKNLFDAMVETFVSAIEKLGHPNIPIVITESG